MAALASGRRAVVWVGDLSVADDAHRGRVEFSR